MASFEKREGAYWTAAHTKPRCEKKVAQQCKNLSIEHYLPLRKRVKRYQRRTVTTYLPMFPGYVFVQVPEGEELRLRRIERIVQLLPVDPVCEQRLIEDLNNVKQLEEAELEQEIVVQPELVPGQPVKITSGPLQGGTGLVERRGGTTRVTINVELLGQSVTAELDVGEVEVEED